MSTFQTLKKRFIDNKLKIFPVIENGKTPLIENWQNDCSYSSLQIIYWLENAPNCNWGLPCTPNDLFVLDIDTHNINGLESAKRLFNDLGIDEVSTLSQKTPSGGLHLIFKSDDDLKKVANTSNSFKDYQGIDIRSDGYILVNPSSINGVEYQLSDKEIMPMPEKLKDFIINQKDLIKPEKKEKKEYIKPEKVEEGNRDESLFEYINNLYFKTRLNEEEIEVLANHFNENICNPPLPSRQVKYKIKKAFKKDRHKCIYLWIGEDDEDEGL